jgi:hypothetical protein
VLRSSLCFSSSDTRQTHGRAAAGIAIIPKKVSASLESKEAEKRLSDTLLSQAAKPTVSRWIFHWT